MPTLMVTTIRGCKALGLECWQGSVVIRFARSRKRLWDEFDTWLKTEKFLASNRS